MATATITREAKHRAMLRAQARINPNLAASIREDIHNLGVCRRRIERQLSGELKIPTTASEPKLRDQMADIDAQLLRLRLDLKLLQP